MKTYLAEAIVVTIFCCLPLGIPAIVFASRVSCKEAAGNVAGARQVAATARRFVLLGFGFGVIFVAIYVFIAFFAAFSGVGV